MSYRAEDGAAASGLAINLPDSISPEILKVAMEISSGLRQSMPSNVNRDSCAVTVGRGAAGAVAVNVYSTKRPIPDRDMIASSSGSSAFTSICLCICCPSLSVCQHVACLCLHLFKLIYCLR